METLNVGTLSTELSIIVPVYNGGKYLRPCLDSIVAQAYSNWELLLIDDGSSDGSAAVCDEYASRDSRITVVHKPNGGQAAARNDGVALSKGRYLCFVDCDDWLAMIQTLEQQQADIVICGYIEEYATRQKHVSADGVLTVYDAQDALKLVLEGRIGSYLWSMLFRREVVQEPMLSLNPYEDHATIFKWISHARRVVTLHQAFYRQLQTSSLHSYNPKNGNHYFLAIKERYYYIADHHLLPGWEAENRRLYLRGCIKLTKDLARMPDYDSQLGAIIEEVRDELRGFLPISRREIGTKYYTRLRLLLADINLYVRLLRLSSVFAISKKRKDKGLV